MFLTMVDAGGAAGLYPVCWHRKCIPTGRLDTSWVALQFVLPQKSGLEEPWEDEVLLESHSESVLAVCAFVWASLLPHCTCLSHVWCELGQQLNSSAWLPPVGKRSCRPQVVSKPAEAESRVLCAVQFLWQLSSRRKWDGEWPRVWLSQLSWLAESQCLEIYKHLQNARAVHFCWQIGKQIRSQCGHMGREMSLGGAEFFFFRSCQCTVVHGGRDVVCAYSRIVFFLLL